MGAVPSDRGHEGGSIPLQSQTLTCAVEEACDLHVTLRPVYKVIHAKHVIRIHRNSLSLHW